MSDTCAKCQSCFSEKQEGMKLERMSPRLWTREFLEVHRGSLDARRMRALLLKRSRVGTLAIWAGAIAAAALALYRPTKCWAVGTRVRGRDDFLSGSSGLDGDEWERQEESGTSGQSHSPLQYDPGAIILPPTILP